MRYVVAICCLVVLISCEKKENSCKKEILKISRSTFMEVNIPTSYHIKSTTHWDMGFIQYVGNSKGENVMIIHSGGQTFHNRAYDKNTLAEELIMNNKIDTLVERDGKIYKEKIFVLLTAERVDDIFRPFFIETVCFPDFADSFSCEEIISSFKLVH